jgi:Zn finger protein HypA/HybF involved in hydrogenase expression
MHEYHIVEQMVRQAVAAAQKRNASRILRVALVMGEKAEMDPEIVRLHFSQAASGTIAASAELVIKRVGEYSGQNGREFYIEDIEVEG